MSNRRSLLIARPMLMCLVMIISIGLPALGIWVAPSLPFVAAIAVVAVALVLFLPVLPVLVFQRRAPRLSALMRWSQAEQRRKGSMSPEIHYQWVRLSDIAPDARLAFIVAEDIMFPVHYGFDWHSIREALRFNRNLQEGQRKRGASSISQQLAKNLFLWPSRTITRKVLETYFAILIEALWPKRRILEVYLNVIQLGRNVFGIEAAARTVFSKPAAELVLQESALLAASLPNPQIYRADTPSHVTRFRQAMIVHRVKKISPEYRRFMAGIGLLGEDDPPAGWAA